MSWQKFEAKLALATLFFVHLFKRILFFWKPQHGLKKFIQAFSGDAIFIISKEERSKFPSYQRCQACSLCTFTCEAIKIGKAPSSFEPKMLPLGFGRSAHESEFLFDEWLPCLECAECTVSCPNNVPVHGMAEQIRERRNKVEFRSY